jgi:apolipoprotein D and lipocalin family protein
MKTLPRLRRYAGLALATTALGACVAGPVGNPHPPEPLKAVDLGRYIGRYYEFARYDSGFEKGCQAVTAEYAVLPGGLVSVLNTCHAGAVDGPVKLAKGRAKPTGDALHAKYKVSFFGPFYVGDYWVLDHADDYDWSIVGEGSGRFLWILTRAQNPSPTLKAALVQRVKDMGYDTALLKLTPQATAKPAP